MLTRARWFFISFGVGRKCVLRSVLYLTILKGTDYTKATKFLKTRQTMLELFEKHLIYLKIGGSTTFTSG